MGDTGKEQFIICLDLATQKELWRTKVGGPWGDGPRCTPTYDDGLVYAIGTPEGDLVCAEAATGKEVWHKNLTKDFGGKMMSGWGFSESPLVDGDKLICTPGAKDAELIALNKKTGDVIWKCAMPEGGTKGRGAAYSSCVVAEVGGIRQYITLTGCGLIGVAAKDGKFLWGYKKVTNGTASITTPVVKGEYVFGSSAYGRGSVGLKLVPTGDGGIKAEELYWLDADTFQNHHGGVVLVGDYLYGGHGQNAGLPVCIELKTGKIMWRAGQAPGGKSAAVAYADGCIYMRYESGLMALVKATPEKYTELGTFTIATKNGPSWPHPVIHGGKLYLRDNDVLLCYDIKKP
jgi:outer membrane protein assembly factor BamB